MHNDAQDRDPAVCSSHVIEHACARGTTSRDRDACRLALELLPVGVGTTMILECLQRYCGLSESSATRALEAARAERWHELAR